VSMNQFYQQQGLLGGMFGGAGGLYGALQQQVQMNQPGLSIIRWNSNPDLNPAPTAANETRGPAVKWLDRRVNELRVKL